MSHGRRTHRLVVSLLLAVGRTFCLAPRSTLRAGLVLDRSRSFQTAHSRVEETDYAGFTYDAVWTYALALDKLFKEDDSYTSNLRSRNTTE